MKVAKVAGPLGIGGPISSQSDVPEMWGVREREQRRQGAIAEGLLAGAGNDLKAEQRDVEGWHFSSLDRTIERSPVLRRNAILPSDCRLPITARSLLYAMHQG